MTLTHYGVLNSEGFLGLGLDGVQRDKYKTHTHKFRNIQAWPCLG